MSEHFDIFISHVSGDTELAGALKASIEQDFINLSVFVSSDSRSITAGEWFKQIKQSLIDSKLVIVLCSPESITHPWIAFEAGAAWLSKESGLVLLCHSGMQQSELATPYHNLQAASIDSKGLSWIYDQITTSFGLKRSPGSDRVDAAVRRLDRAVQAILEQRQLREWVNCVMALGYRDTPRGREFLLVRTNSGGRWTFPKGTIKRGTDRSKLFELLRGELRREGGANGELFDKHFGPFVYTKNSGEERHVLAFPVRIETDAGPTEHGREPRWCSIDNARHLLSEGRSAGAAKGLTDALRFVAEFSG
jgi:hypothetical protein